ncbi:MAG: T9SS type A sorting domain-containing protein [Bacteroidota bacterium]
MAWLNTETIVTKAVKVSNQTEVGMDAELGVTTSAGVESKGPVVTHNAEATGQVTGKVNVSSSITYTVDPDQQRLFKFYGGRPANVSGTPIPRIFPLGSAIFTYDFLPDGICAPQDQNGYRILNPGGHNRDVLMQELHLNEEDLITFDRKILAYPNPTEDFITLKQIDKIDFQSVLIFDLFGRIIKNFENINSSEIKIDLRGINHNSIYISTLDKEGNQKTEIINLIK